jgi:hypothetical protein
LAKAEVLVDCSYGDLKHHAIMVLADGATALPWREAQAQIKVKQHQNSLL